jgi:hypothetical protein
MAALGTGLILSGLGGAPVAQALPYGCEEIVWGTFNNQQRQICDGPLAADGSWMRHRVIGIPAGYRQSTSQCYGGGIVSGFSVGWQNCVNTPGGLYAQVTLSNDTYRVYPDAVPFGEPGYLG